MHDKINEQVEASSEVAQVVAALERQYDAFVAAQENRSLLARDEDLPSGDELGAEFERFLAQQAGDKFTEAPKATTATSALTRPDNEVGEMTERKPNLRTVRELTPSLQFRTIHGYRRAFRVAGSGPAILLIHGIGDNSTTWSTVQSKLAQRFTVIAPDLLGHGKSDKPRADYSVRRLRQRHARPAERARHRPRHRGRSLARRRRGDAVRLPVPAIGRPADPGRRRRRDQGRQHRAALSPRCRWAARRWPCCGCRWCCPRCRWSGGVAGALFGSTGLGRDLPDVLRILADLPEPTASSAFARTLRAVVDWRGQVVTMLDRCYLTQSVPVQLIWGARDSVIPVSHARMAHAAMPGSQSRDLRRLRAFPVPRRSGPLRRSRRAVHRLHRAGRLRPGLSCAICCGPASAKARSPDRSTPGSPCSTRWAPTNAAPPDRRPAATS